MAVEAGRRTFRATSALVVMILSTALALFLLGDAVLRAGPVVGLLLAPWVLLALWSVYVFIYVSCVQTDASGIRVRNLLRIIDVPWQQVSDIEMRWQLRVHLRAGGIVSSFGGPSARRPPSPVRSDAARPAKPPAERESAWIHDQWESALRQGDGQGNVRRSWDLRALAALVLIATWAIIAVLTTGGPS